LTIQNKIKLQQNYFCTKKDKKFIFPTKIVISKNCINYKNGYLNFFYKNNPKYPKIVQTVKIDN